MSLLFRSSVPKDILVVVEKAVSLGVAATLSRFCCRFARSKLELVVMEASVDDAAFARHLPQVMRFLPMFCPKAFRRFVSRRCASVYVRPWPIARPFEPGSSRPAGSIHGG